MDTVILGVRIDVLDKNKILGKIEEYLSGQKQHYIVTPNPEILLAARHDDEFFHILNKADLSIPDGIGLKFAAWAGGDNITRITGADLLLDILDIAKNKKSKIAFLVWKDGLSKKEDIANSVKEIYGIDAFCDEISREWTDYDMTELTRFSPEIVIVGLGAPWQEKFIYHNLDILKDTKLLIGIGGGIDFLTKKIKRSPSFMRSVGLEWLWRLVVQPWRAKRIFNAVIVFPIVFFKQRFINKFFYRKNVVGFLVNDQNEVLILNWCKNGDYWGLPQGGVKFLESKEDAIKREMLEETGTSNFQIIKMFSNIYRYKWPKEYTNSGYKGQKQSLLILKYQGKNEEVKINQYEHKEFKWVKIEKVLDETDPVHKQAYSIFLKKYYETQA